MPDTALALRRARHCIRRVTQFVVLLVASTGCASQLSDLPSTSGAAFALEDRPRRNTTLMETVVVKGTIADALKAAEEAFVSVGFEERPASWTAERRCAEYTLSWHEWPFWGCMYFEPGPEGSLRCRIIVESWTSFGVKTSQPWHLHLAAAFQGRLRAIQDARR